MSLKQFRETLRIPIRDAAKRAGIATASLQLWEGGDRQPRPENLEAVLNVYRVEAARRIDLLARLIRQPSDTFSR